jgi:hypothetical protein
MLLTQAFSGPGSTSLTIASIITVATALVVLIVGVRNRRK